MTDARQLDLPLWKDYVKSLTVEPLFVTVSGAHLYGFPSPDSDVDLRACHQLPLDQIVGLSLPNQTFEHSSVYANLEVDIVSHDIGKYFGLLVKNNGYVLEQIFSPFVVTGKDFLDQLRPIARRCITRFHYYHYRGFYQTQRKLIDKQAAKTAKAILYAYRVLLTGIHLLRTGEVEANLLRLADEYGNREVHELILQKTSEKISPAELNWELHSQQLDSLESTLDAAFQGSQLSEQRDLQEVNRFLVDLRLA
ncbi:MAG: nucleotidyltransferase domain-containing protein [Planctomycetales bacterium]|nr:nucleotidyltransferase domain-containing protein [Planctomycetales bacterium]